MTRNQDDASDAQRHSTASGNAKNDSFVIWLDPAEPGGSDDRCQGTVEHVPSSRRVRFDTGEELLGFLRAAAVSIALAMGVIVLAPATAMAQLAGDYTVGGTSPDYATLADAVSALQGQGISAPVNMNLRAGTYSTASGTDRALDIASPITGASTTNRVVFQPDGASGATRADVVLERASGTDSGGWVVRIKSGHVTLRQLTLRSVYSGPMPGALVLIDLLPDLEDVSVEGCIIDGGLYVQKGLDVQNFRDVRVLDNDITAVGDGVRMGGYNPSWDPRVEGNRMYGLFTYNLGGSVHGTGIELENVHDPIVRRNELDYGDAAGQTGIHLYQARNFEMEANAVHSVESGGLYGSFTGIHVRGSVSTGRVVNNMVAVMTYRRTGIYVTSSGIEIAHNTVLLAQTGIDPFGGSKALELHGTNATVVNNVFIEDGSGASVEAMKLGVSPATSLFDGNMLWSRDALIRDNGVVRSLLDWQALGHGANSIEKRDLEVVDELTDLHLQGCSGVDPDLVGIPYPTLLSDLDGQARSATEPARGADEYGGGTLPSFGASTELFVGDIPAQAAAADFDGDGDRDLVVTRLDANQPPTLALFENQGGGSFVSMGQIGLGGSDAPLILRAEDMDGDGYGDIAVSFDGTAAPHLRVHWGDGLFGFSQQTDVSASQSGTAQPDWVSDFELADVDGDADLDIVATHLGAVGVAPTGGKLMVFCQRPGRVLTTEDAVDLTNPYDIEVGDLDGDGDPDAAVQDFDGSLAWVRNVSGSCESFAQITSVAAAGSVDSAPLWPSMALADFDDDADVDLVYDDQTNPEGISLHRNDGSGSFASAESIFVESYAERLPGPLTSLDVEGDGDMDLLIGNELGSFPGQSVLLANDGTGTFGRVLVCGESTLPSPPRMLLATDLDGDMLPDVVAPTNDPDDVSIILNTGNAPPSAVLVGPTAERNTSGVDVAWSTLLEIGNAGFEVQRRIGVGSWLALDFIVGAGTTSVPQAYAYADPGASTTNLTTYRLRQEDTGGSSTYSDEVHVSAAPEPGTLAGITSGAGLLWWLDRRRQRRRRG